MRRDVRWFLAVALAGALGLGGARPAWAGTDWTRGYAVKNVPDSLSRGMDACVRYQRSRLAVKSGRDATLEYEMAITIFTTRAEDLAEVFVPYDRFRRIEDLQAWIVNADGKLVKTIGGGDIHDFKLDGMGNLADDVRGKTFSLRGDGLPYTIVYSYREVCRGLLFLSDWDPLPSLGNDVRISLEDAACRVTSPADYPVRFKAIHIPGDPVVSQDGDRGTRTWTLAALRPPVTEAFGLDVSEKLPRLLLAPSEFELEGLKGGMTDWTALGRWYRELWNAAADLPDSAAQDIAARCGTLPDERAKIACIYRKLQTSTRYVSVQLGIGGWRPFPASYVARNRYGDCKALTNYMMSMLASAGVTAVPALVMAGAGAPDMEAEFPSNQFNHVILCVPGASDTTWLECTSSDAPAGHLGVFTEDRHVLLLLPEGGRVAHTPASRSTDNRQVLVADCRVAAGGGISGQLSLAYAGNPADRTRSILLRATPSKRETWLNRELGLARAELSDADYSGIAAGAAEARVRCSLRTPEVARRVGDRIALTLNAFDPLQLPLPAMSHRLDPVDLTFPFVDTDTLRFALPAGYTLDAVPPPVRIEGAFGSYDATVTLVGASAGAGNGATPTGGTASSDVVVYVRRLEIARRTIPAADYAAFRDFVLEVSRADHAQVILRPGS